MNGRLNQFAGAPNPDNQNSQSARPGPVLVHDYQVTGKLAHHLRERIAERVVHAEDNGPSVTQTVTGDLIRYSGAKLSEPGKKTGLLIRFPSVAGDAARYDYSVDGDDFIQPRALSRILPFKHKLRLVVSNFGEGLRGVPNTIVERQLTLVAQVNPENTGGARTTVSSLLPGGVASE
jgi:catalase